MVRAVRLLTNDPEQEALRLEIFCTVIRPLDAEPSAVSLSLNPSAASEEKRTAATVVYSQTWDQFDLAATPRSLDGVTWRITPADKAALEPFGARSGYRVECTIAPDMPEGYFNGSLDLVAKPSAAGQQPRTLALPIQGRVQGRVALLGPRGPRRNAGPRHAQRGRQPYHLLSREGQRRLQVARRQGDRDQSRVPPRPPGADRQHAAEYGLYRFEVEMANARRCNFSSTAGFIRLKTDHPRLPVVNLRVEMAVLSAT